MCIRDSIEMMLDLAEEYRRICPDVIIIAGGPEVSYQSQQILEENPALDGILRGEGEQSFLEFQQYLEKERPIE